MFSLKQNTLFVILTVLISVSLSACGGAKTSKPTKHESTPKELAMRTIAAFAKDHTKPAPTLQNYIDAGVQGVTRENLAELNTVIQSLKPEDVDTAQELEQITSKLGINIAPTANAGGNRTTRVNQSITITGSGTDADGSISSYEWKKGEVVLSNEASFSFTPSKVGTDTLTLTVIDDDGDVASDSIEVLVTKIPTTPNKVPTANAGSDRTIQVNQTITIAGSGTDSDGAITRYEWKKGSTVLASTQSFDYTPTKVGTSTLTLTVFDNDGDAASDSIEIYVTAIPVVPNKAPTANAGSNKTVQVNKSITISGGGSDSDGTIAAYEWKKGSTVLSNKASFKYTPTKVGVDILMLTVIDNDGDTASDSIEVDVTQAPVAPNKAPTANAGNNKTVQVNKSITITGSGSDSDGTIDTYEWKKGSTVLSNKASFKYTPTQVGTDTLTLIVTDNKGKSSEDNMRVVVTPTPDTTAPVLTLIGDASVNVVKGSVYTDAGATASDNKDGNITSRIAVTGDTVNTSLSPDTSFTIIYNVSDAAGNPANQVTRTVIIIDIEDTIDPEITLNGGTSVEAIKGSTYVDAGATASDNKDGDITANIKVAGDTVNTQAEPGATFTITYNVKDATGNSAIEVTRTVSIIANPNEGHFIPELTQAEITNYLTLINNARATARTCGGGNYGEVPPVTWSDKLYRMAYEHSQDMTESNFFDHAGSGNESDWSRPSAGTPSHFTGRAASYNYGGIRSENIAAGVSSAQAVINLWLGSAGHCANIMSPNVNQVGLALSSKAGTQWGNYWTQNFGYGY